MLFRPHDQGLLNDIDERLRSANAASSDLFFLVLKACSRLGACNPTMLKRLRQMLEIGAYTDAALTIVDREQPAWKLRRLSFNSGEWHCSLSRNGWVPIEVDETADAHHECLSLAILRAFVEARRASPVKSSPAVTTVPQIKFADYSIVCCDNFS